MDIPGRVTGAVAHYWRTRTTQAAKSTKTGNARDAVTGGAHLDGFVNLLRDLAVESGAPRECVFYGRGDTALPGAFRATKRWDLVIAAPDRLVAAVEIKAIASSFGNNLNNRAEEALGSGLDLRRAAEQGVFGEDHQPWLGYVLLMAETIKSGRPVRMASPHFAADDKFKDATYLTRGKLLCAELVASGLYDSAWYLTSTPRDVNGGYTEPDHGMGMSSLSAAFTAAVSAAYPS